MAPTSPRRPRGWDDEEQEIVFLKTCVINGAKGKGKGKAGTYWVEVKGKGRGPLGKGKGFVFQGKGEVVVSELCRPSEIFAPSNNNTGDEEDGDDADSGGVVNYCAVL